MGGHGVFVFRLLQTKMNGHLTVAGSWPVRREEQPSSGQTLTLSPDHSGLAFLVRSSAEQKPTHAANTFLYFL